LPPVVHHNIEGNEEVFKVHEAPPFQALNMQGGGMLTLTEVRKV